MTPEIPYPRRGWIYFIRVDDEPGRKKRPALVVSPDVRNRLSNSVIVVPISTNLRTGPAHVRLRRGEGGIKKASIIKCEHISTLPKGDVMPPSLGRSISGTRMIEVEKAILRAIGVPVH